MSSSRHERAHVKLKVRRDVPSFSLYGEQLAPGLEAAALHIEDIQSRSRKYLWRIGSHRHAGRCQCVYVTAGPVTVDIEGAQADGIGPTVFIIPSGAVHGFLFGADSQGYVLTLSLDRLLGMTSAAQQAAIAQLFAAPRTLKLRDDPSFAERAGLILEALLREFLQPTAQEPVLAWLACATLWMLAHKSRAAAPLGTLDSLDLDRLTRFRLLIETHYAEHWPVAHYARQLALSDSSLNRLCRNLAGATAFDVIQQRLALEARRRLLYAAGAVAAIATELGFKDPAYFCRFFRKHTGVSPTAYRRRQSDR